MIGLEKNGVTLVWKVEVTLFNTPDVTFGGAKDDTLVVRLDVTMDVTLRVDVCDFGLEVNTVEVTENRLERNGVTLVWKVEVTLFNTLDVTFGDIKDDTLIVILDVTMDVTLRDAVCDSGLKVNTVEVTENRLESNGVTLVWKLEVTLGLKDVTLAVSLEITVDATLVLFSDDLTWDSTLDDCNVKDNGVTLPVESENRLERNGVTLVWKVEVTLFNTLDVTFGDTKANTLVIILDVTMDVTLRDDVCDFGLEVNTVEVTENRLERNGVTLVWKVEVTLFNTLDVTFGDIKDDTLIVILDVTMDVTLRDAVCDSGLKVNTVEVTENRLESNGVTLVWKLEVTLGLKDVTLAVSLEITVDTTLVLFSDDLIWDSTLDDCNVKDNGVTLPVESGVTLRVSEVFFNNIERVKTVLRRVNSELFLCVATELVNDTVNLVNVEVLTCVTSMLTNVSTVLVFIVIKGVTDKALLSVTMVLRI